MSDVYWPANSAIIACPARPHQRLGGMTDLDLFAPRCATLVHFVWKLAWRAPSLSNHGRKNSIERRIETERCWGQISGASNSPQPPVHVWSPGQRQAVASCLRRGESGQQLLADSRYLPLPQQNEPGTSESDSQRATGCDGTSAFARRRHRKKPKCRNFALKLPGSLSLSARHSVGGQARVIRYFSVAKVRRDKTQFGRTWALAPLVVS